MSISSSEIEPLWWMSSSLRSAMTTLASSRATSHMITSPSGRVAGSDRRITLQTESVAHSNSIASSTRSRGATMRMWSTAARLAAASGGPGFHDPPRRRSGAAEVRAPRAGRRPAAAPRARPARGAPGRPRHVPDHLNRSTARSRVAASTPRGVLEQPAPLNGVFRLCRRAERPLRPRGPCDGSGAKSA